MKTILSYILYLFIFAGGVVVAVLSDDKIVMFLGIMISLFTLITSILTMSDIEKLKKASQNAVYFGETVDEVPEIIINKTKS